MPNANSETKNIKASKTAEGFIEFTSLDELDHIFGGLLDPETVFCQLEEETKEKQPCA